MNWERENKENSTESIQIVKWVHFARKKKERKGKHASNFKIILD